MSNSEIILTRAEAREADRIAIEDYGIPGVVLMENAGRGAAEIIARLAGDRRTVQIYCGPGNNGGDGYVIARHLTMAGFNVRVILACERGRIGGDAAVNLRIIEKMGFPIEGQGNPRPRESAELIVDALLGTGSSGDPRGEIAEAINLINKKKVQAPTSIVFAVDIPSGLDADSGAAANPTVRADHTITFMGLKRGFTTECAKEYVGKVHVAHIGSPAELIKRES